MSVLFAGAAFSVAASALTRGEFVAEINAVSGITWTAAEQPRFAGLPVGASKSSLGTRATSPEALAAGIRAGWLHLVTEAEIAEAKAMDMPVAFDSATNWPSCAEVINDIRDQVCAPCALGSQYNVQRAHPLLHPRFGSV
jgi:hypothetical protein